MCKRFDNMNSRELHVSTLMGFCFYLMQITGLVAIPQGAALPFRRSEVFFFNQHRITGGNHYPNNVDDNCIF